MATDSKLKLGVGVIFHFIFLLKAISPNVLKPCLKRRKPFGCMEKSCGTMERDTIESYGVFYNALLELVKCVFDSLNHFNQYTGSHLFSLDFPSVDALQIVILIINYVLTSNCLLRLELGLE